MVCHPKIDKLKLKALIMSGTSGPMIFVKNEITKKTNKIMPTKNLLLINQNNLYQSDHLLPPVVFFRSRQTFLSPGIGS